MQSWRDSRGRPCLIEYERRTTCLSLCSANHSKYHNVRPPSDRIVGNPVLQIYQTRAINRPIKTVKYLGIVWESRLLFPVLKSPDTCFMIELHEFWNLRQPLCPCHSHSLAAHHWPRLFTTSFFYIYRIRLWIITNNMSQHMWKAF